MVSIPLVTKPIIIFDIMSNNATIGLSRPFSLSLDIVKGKLD